GEQSGRVGINRDLGDHVLDHLVGAYRLAELLAGFRVGNGGLKASLDDADAARGDRDATLVEGLHGVFEALAFLTDQRVRADAYIVEGNLGGGLTAQAELAVDEVALEPRSIGRNQESRDAASTVLSL